MRLQTKLVVAFLFIAIIPLASSYWRLTVDVYTIITDQRDLSQNEQLAIVSRQLVWNLEEAADSLRLGVASFDLERLRPEEREGILRLLYEQRPYVNALQLLDAQQRPLTNVVRLTNAGVGGHCVIGDVDLASWEGLATQARGGAVAWGAPFRAEGDGTDLIPFAISQKKGDSESFFLLGIVNAVGASGGEAMVSRLADTKGEGTRSVFLLDTSGHSLLTATSAEKNEQVEVPPPLLPLLFGEEGGQLRSDIGGVPSLVAWHEVEGTRWRLVVTQPTSEVYSPLKRPLVFAFYWMVVSMVIAAVYGFYFSRTLSTPIRDLAAGVLEVARGNLEARVKVHTRDEVGELAETFNYMAGELKSQKAEIERQSEEIRNWNKELQARVEDRTRELREAQGYLIHTQKLAAVAELGSGVAHELNNPLAAILGFVQILIAQNSSPADVADGKASIVKILKHVEEQTQRCRDIVHHLLRFSQEQVDRGSYGVVNVSEVVGTVLKLFEGTFAAKRVTVKNPLAEIPLFSWGNRAQLLQAFLQLFSAVRSILSPEARLEIRGERNDTTVYIEIEGPLRYLESAGTDPFRQHESQDQAMAQGLGLWVAREIFREHEGGLEIEIPADAPDTLQATLVVTLPLRANERTRTDNATPPASGASEEVRS